METITAHELRGRTIAHIASHLFEDFQQGKKVAQHQIEQVIDGVNLVVNCDLSHLSKQVESALGELSKGYRSLRYANYHVKLNTINGICQFTAHLRTT